MINPMSEREVLELMGTTSDPRVYRVCQTLLELYQDLAMLDAFLEEWNVGTDTEVDVSQN